MTALAVINGVAIVVLVGVTAYYAWQTRQMAREMRHARLLSLLPKLVLDVETAGPTYGLIVVRNVGAGPALDADLHIHFGDQDKTIEHRRWLAHVIAPGEQHEFLPPREISGMTALVGRYPIISLRGEMKDALKQQHNVDERVDIREWWSNLEAVQNRWREQSADRLIRELEKSRKELGKIQRELSGIANAIARQAAPRDR